MKTAARARGGGKDTEQLLDKQCPSISPLDSQQDDVAASAGAAGRRAAEPHGGD